MLRILLAGLAVLPAHAGAQTTRVVPTQFASVNAAIAASAPGDIIELLPGIHPTFTLDKGLTIVGQSATIYGGFGVTRIPAGQVARISGLATSLFHAIASFGMRIEDCTGAVHVSGYTSPAAGDSSLIIRSAHVTLQGSRFRGQGSPILITSSFVQISDCWFGSEREGLVCTAADVRVAASEFVSLGYPIPGLVSSAPAIRQVSGTLVLGAGSTATAGPGFGTSAAIVADGALGLDPGVTLSSTGGAPTVSGTGTSIAINAASSVITEATVGGMFSGKAIAPVGALCGIHLGLPAPPVISPFGPFELSGFAIAIDVGVVPASGERAFSFPVTAATPLGFTVSTQAFVNDGGVLYLSVSSTAVFGR
jgi:hypothetical protein